MTETSKRRGGRPRLPESRRRTLVVTVRLSDEEHDRIMAAAERDGAVYYGGNGKPSLSGWIRAAALEKAKACGARANVGH